jgi:hypothetical protein
MDMDPDRKNAKPTQPDLSESSDSPFDKGLQPLDRLMQEHNLLNHDLVKVAPRFLTHKMVQKGRTGRRLTAKVQRRLLEAARQVTGAPLEWADLFNYRG